MWTRGSDRRRAVAGACSIFLSCVCAPQRSAAQALSLSLPNALERSLQHAPELVLAEQQLREIDARRNGAGILLPANPRLTVEARPTLSSQNFGTLGYAATVDTVFDLGGAPGARVREVDRDVALGSASRDLERVVTRLRVTAAYVGAQLSQLRAEAARQGIELARRVLDAADKRIEAGAASEFERASAQLELSRIEASEQSALRERDEQLMQLREVLDIPGAQELSLTTRVDTPAPLAPLPTFLDAASQRHPDLLVLLARLSSLSATQERLERETFPRLGLFAGVDAAPKSPVFGVVGISGELPVAQRNQGPRAVVARALETERTRLELQKRRIEREIRGSFESHERRRAEYAVLSESGLPAAERSFELAEAGWRAGRFDWFRVALASRDLVALRSARIEALTALWSARIALARARGGDVP
mgnify:FL=1